MQLSTFQFDEELHQLGRGLQKEAVRLGHADCPSLHRLKAHRCWSSVSWLYHWMTGGGSGYLAYACHRALDEMAEPLRLHRETLFDKYLPDFGFAAGPLEFPYGGRGQFRATLDGESNVHIWRGDRELSSLPRPLVADDPEEIDAIRAAMRSLKREIRRTSKLIEKRLERAIAKRYAWRTPDWLELVGNPLFRNAARHRLWGVFTYPAVYDRLFMVDATGSPVGVDDRPVPLDEGTTIRAVDSEVLTQDDRATWSTRFAEYELHTDQFAEPPPREYHGQIVGLHPGAADWCSLNADERDLLLEEYAAAGWVEADPEKVPSRFGSETPLVTKTFADEGVTAIVSVGSGGGDIQFRSLYFDCHVSDVPAPLRAGLEHEVCVVAENVNSRVKEYDPDRWGIRGYL
jgi:hypothetical protein